MKPNPGTMLPLFGRTGRKPSPAIKLNDEWCIPSDQEIFGRSLICDEIPFLALNDVSNETIINSPSLSNDTESFQSMNGADDCEEIISVDTFATMNNETTIVNAMEELEIMETDDESKEVKAAEDNADNAYDDLLEKLETILLRVKQMEKICDDLERKISKLENDNSKKGCSEFNAHIFVKEFGRMIQDLMENGMAFQQTIVGNLIDEIDGIFDIDFKNFDPFK